MFTVSLVRSWQGIILRLVGWTDNLLFINKGKFCSCLLITQLDIGSFEAQRPSHKVTIWKFIQKAITANKRKSLRVRIISKHIYINDAHLSYVKSDTI
jgi:hypothetical protein